ncbi:MAG TPA: metallophosphoesterase family protein [Phototrophicaceae bacterium]|nr:metallophosphoesterase family protein [Phototrophicaceae bacterium]
MRIAIISDIHGNAYALDQALADIARQAVDQMVCLGDAIQGGPQPAEVVARLRELPCPVVMGNADAWLLTGIETGAEPTSPERQRKLDAVRAWSLSKLSADDRAFIAAFQPTVEIPLNDERKLLCFHGSPTSFDEIILPTMPEAEFQAIFASYLPSLVTGGHTHLQQIRPIGTTDAFFFNPGSVGFAYGHGQAEGTFYANAWAEYAILTVERVRIALEFRRVAYDAAALIDIYRSSGRPFADEAIAQYRAQ